MAVAMDSFGREARWVVGALMGLCVAVTNMAPTDAVAEPSLKPFLEAGLPYEFDVDSDNSVFGAAGGAGMWVADHVGLSVHGAALFDEGANRYDLFGRLRYRIPAGPLSIVPAYAGGRVWWDRPGDSSGWKHGPELAFEIPLSEHAAVQVFLGYLWLYADAGGDYNAVSMTPTFTYTF